MGMHVPFSTALSQLESRCAHTAMLVSLELMCVFGLQVSHFMLTNHRELGTQKRAAVYAIKITSL